VEAAESLKYLFIHDLLAHSASIFILAGMIPTAMVKALNRRIARIIGATFDRHPEDLGCVWKNRTRERSYSIRANA